MINRFIVYSNPLQQGDYFFLVGKAIIPLSYIDKDNLWKLDLAFVTRIPFRLTNFASTHKLFLIDIEKG